jgi:chemotaxis signal transduction protein
MMEPVLLVQAGRFRVALRMVDVLEVTERSQIHLVPNSGPALRGVTDARGRLVPVVHLGALLGDAEAPATQGDTLVIASIGSGTVALEVEAADAISHGELLPVPPENNLPWAGGAIRLVDGWVPVLKFEALGERLRAMETWVA